MVDGSRRDGERRRGIRARGISLWWLPPPEEAAVLDGVIARLAAAHGTPAFPAHVTLLGGIAAPDVLDRARRLAAALSPVEIRLGEYGHERVPTRWLFRYVVPTEAVVEAGRRARQAFPELRGKPFTPHLSLVYGDRDDALARRIIAADPAPPARFLARELAVVRTEGPVEDWRELLRLPLG